jgi:HlyD family secretion protein
VKKIYLVPIVVLAVFLVVYFGFLRNKKPAFTLMEVKRGDISQEVSETGAVKKGEGFNLTFKSSGKLQKIYVKVGDEVKAGAILAELDSSQLYFQLNEAQGNLELYQAKLDKLLAGASKEEIQADQTKVKNAEIDLENAKQDLEDSYQDALNTLDDAYLKIYNAYNTADIVQRAYFNGNDQESLMVKDNKGTLGEALSGAKSYLDSAKAASKNEDIDASLTGMKTELDSVSGALKVIRETCETDNYRSVVSSTNKTSLDTQRTNINTALTSITGAQQAVSSAKLSVESYEGDLQVAKDNLTLLTASPRKEDVDLYQAQVKQAQAQVQLLESQISDTRLRSPVDGQITKIDKRTGETVQPALDTAIITLLPSVPFEIEVDIYEEDVVKMAIGNPVDISLVAFPDKVFTGKVRMIDPAQKLVNEVVYYEATIDFDQIPEGLRPGMSADLTIKTASRQNVLLVSTDAIQTKDGKTFVQVSKNGKSEEREIQIGLQGSQGFTEVISGLTDGEKVVLK